MKNGFRKRNVRVKQSFLCKSCGKQFVEPDGFKRMRHEPKIIVQVIHMHKDYYIEIYKKSSLVQYGCKTSIEDNSSRILETTRPHECPNGCEFGACLK